MIVLVGCLFVLMLMVFIYFIIKMKWVVVEIEVIVYDNLFLVKLMIDMIVY